MQLYLQEKIGLTERERRFATYVISNAVCELREYHRREKNPIDRTPEDKALDIGYARGQNNAARNIAGSSLSELFGCYGFESISALENLSKKEEVHTFCPIVVEECYEELEKVRRRS